MIVINTKWDLRFLELAKFVSTWSKDPSTKVGSVIVDPDKRIQSIGFNGFPKGIDDSLEKYENKEYKYQIVKHAEENALNFAPRNLKGSSIYIYPFLSCPSCTGNIIQRGIKRVVTYQLDTKEWREYHNISLDLYKQAGIEVISYEDACDERYYMCKTAFDYDIKSHSEKIYPTLKSVREGEKCVDECGIMEVMVKGIKNVQDGKL